MLVVDLCSQKRQTVTHQKHGRMWNLIVTGEQSTCPVLEILVIHNEWLLQNQSQCVQIHIQATIDTFSTTRLAN